MSKFNIKKISEKSIKDTIDKFIKTVGSLGMDKALNSLTNEMIDDLLDYGKSLPPDIRKFVQNEKEKRMKNIQLDAFNLSRMKKNAAEYKGKEVELDKPMKGDVKKYKVYVKNDKGNVVKVNFGDPNMEIKRDDPERRKNFRARHNCDEKKDKTTPGYWSCKMWSDKPVSEIVSYNLSKMKKVAKEELKGGKADGKPDSKYNKKQLEEGIKVEMEHTNDPKKAKEIAKDHLEECPNYYTRLDKMEEECKKKSFNLSKIKKKAQEESDETEKNDGGKINYFSALSKESDELTKKALEYLDKFDFLTVDEMSERIWKAAWEKLNKLGESGIEEKWDELPEWIKTVYDGYIPYSQPPKNGSLYYALGYSPAASEANLRNLLEIAEGRETEELNLPIVPPKDFWKKYPELSKEIEGNNTVSFNLRKIKKKAAMEEVDYALEVLDEKLYEAGDLEDKMIILKSFISKYNYTNRPDIVERLEFVIERIADEYKGLVTKSDIIKEVTASKKKSFNISKIKKAKKGRCWDGYEPTPGKKPYSPGSCKKKEKTDSSTKNNPWAICHTTVNKKKDPDKYERCVKDVKEK